MKYIVMLIAATSFSLVVGCGKMTQSEQYKESYRQAYVDGCVKEAMRTAAEGIDEEDIRKYCECALQRTEEKYPDLSLKNTLKAARDNELQKEIAGECGALILGEDAEDF